MNNNVEFIKSYEPEQGYGGNEANVMMGITGQLVVLTGGINDNAPYPDNKEYPNNAVDKWTAFNPKWQRIGWTTSDGITEGYEDETEDIDAWPGGAIIRSVTKKTKSTLKFQCQESSDLVLSLFHKTQVIPGADGLRAFRILTPGKQIHSFGLDIKDGNTFMRLVIPKGEVAERAEITYKTDETMKYELTLTMYAGSNGDMGIKMFQDWEQSSKALKNKQQRERVSVGA